MSPARARSFLSNSSGSLGFGVTNPTAHDLDVRVRLFDEAHPINSTVATYGCLLGQRAGPGFASARRSIRQTGAPWKLNRDCPIEELAKSI